MSLWRYLLVSFQIILLFTDRPTVVVTLFTRHVAFAVRFAFSLACIHLSSCNSIRKWTRVVSSSA